MKKEVNIVIGDFGLSAFGAQCVNIVGPCIKLETIAFGVCSDMEFVSIRGVISELWFYRGILIFRDGNEFFEYCVPVFFLGVSRFTSLHGAKAAISRFRNRKGGVK